MSVKMNSTINLQHLIFSVITILGAILLWAFTQKGQIDLNKRDIYEEKENRKEVNKKLDEIQQTLFEIQLELKEKADRKGG